MLWLCQKELALTVFLNQTNLLDEKGEMLVNFKHQRKYQLTHLAAD